MNINNTLVTVLNGTAHTGAPSTYWAAQAFKNGLRKKDALARLGACRKALKQFGVTVWQIGNKIEIRKNAVAVATFEVKP
jgi:hypothetical protein